MLKRTAKVFAEDGADPIAVADPMIRLEADQAAGVPGPGVRGDDSLCQGQIVGSFRGSELRVDNAPEPSHVALTMSGPALLRRTQPFQVMIADPALTQAGRKLALGEASASR